MAVRPILAALALCFVTFACTVDPPSAPAPNVHSAEAVRADLTTLYLTLAESHYDLFARRPRTEYDANYSSLSALVAADMAHEDVLALFQRFTAFGRIAHASVDGSNQRFTAHRASGGTALPLQVRIRGPRTFITHFLGAETGVDHGDELLAINGRPLSDLIGAAAHYIAADTPYLMVTMLEHRFGWVVWEEFGAPDSFQLTLRKSDGETVQVDVKSLPRDQMLANYAALPGRLELDATHREQRMLDENVAYLRPGPFYNVDGGDNPWDATEYLAFLDQAFERFLDAGATTLVIDLRDNPGGGNTFSDPMVAWFADRPFRFASSFRIRVSEAASASNAGRLPDAAPGTISHQLAAAYATRRNGETFEFEIEWMNPRESRRYTGAVVVLVNRHTYSNAANVAALVQDFGFGRVFGEETADLTTTYGAMEHFTLPRTGIRVGFPKAYIVRPNGDEAVRGVVPDVRIETPLIESEGDPVLQAVLQRIGGASQAPGLTGGMTGTPAPLVSATAPMEPFRNGRTGANLGSPQWSQAKWVAMERRQD